MTVVNIHEAKTNFSKLINAALRGEEIIIAKSGKPLIKLEVFEEALSPRKGGQLCGLLEINEDFDEPLPDETLEQFYKDGNQ